MCEIGGLFGGGLSGASSTAPTGAPYAAKLKADEEKARRERERDLKRQAEAIRFGAQRAATAARGAAPTFSRLSPTQSAMFQTGKSTLGGGA